MNFFKINTETLELNVSDELFELGENETAFSSMEGLGGTKLTIAQLVTLYNANSNKDPIKTFRDRNVAVKRVWNVLNPADQVPVVESDEEEPEVPSEQEGTVTPNETAPSTTGDEPEGEAAPEAAPAEAPKKTRTKHDTDVQLWPTEE